ncbi:stAR-related lipid transfer protein 6-like [Ciona intestinalis]
MDYNKIATSIEIEVLKIRDSKQWIKLPSQKGVEISFTDSPSFNGHCYKFSCIIEAPCDVVYGVLKPPPTTEERLRWDKSIDDYQPLVTIDENTFISAITTPSILMGLISGREFVDLFRCKVVQTSFNEERWVFAGSVSCDQRPVTKKYIRATTHPSGYVAIPVDSNKTQVEFHINIDVGGMLPRSLVESNLPSQQVKYIENLSAEVHRRCLNN